MKGLAGSTGTVAVIALGLFAGGATAKQEPTDHGLAGGVDAARSPSTKNTLGSSSHSPRHHQRAGRRTQVVNDDAIDAKG
ncbi:unnamed protein product, partial [Laminaria digitata]